MGGPIVMEQKEGESIGCLDMKHNHYVTWRQRDTVRDRGDFSAFPSSHLVHFYPAALKGSGVLSYPGRAGGWAGGWQGRQAPLTLSRPQFFTDHFQT